MRRAIPLLLILLFSACTAGQPPTAAAPVEPPVSPSPTTAGARSPDPPAPTQSASLQATLRPTSAPPAPSDTPAYEPALCSPLGGYALEELPGIVSSPFEAPRPGKDDGHHGVDFAHYQYGDRVTIAGAAVQAVFSGRVAAAIADSIPYGHFVIVESSRAQVPAALAEYLSLGPGRAVYQLFAHLEQSPEVRPGEAVDCGEKIGEVGNSGWSGNFHLHLELRTGPADVLFEGMSYYQTTTTDLERANYERWRFGGEFIPIDPMRVIAGP